MSVTSLSSESLGNISLPTFPDTVSETKVSGSRSDKLCWSKLTYPFGRMGLIVPFVQASGTEGHKCRGVHFPGLDGRRSCQAAPSK